MVRTSGFARSREKILATLGTTGASWAQEPPHDESTILVEEIPHIAERSVMYSLPPDPESAIEALPTYPGAADDVCTPAANPTRWLLRRAP